MVEIEDFQLNFGMVIRKTRDRQGYSQESFADEVGVHRTYMGSVERGEINISIKNMLRISASLNKPLSSLIKNVENRNKGNIRVKSKAKHKTKNKE